MLLGGVDEFRCGSSAQLPHQPRAMAADCMNAAAYDRGDLLVPLSFGDQLEHLALPGRQGVVVLRIARRNTPLTGRDPFDHIDESIRGVVFHDIAPCPGAAGSSGEVCIGMHRHDDNSRLRGQLRNSPRCLDSIEEGHGDVDERYVRPVLSNLLKE